MELIYIVAGIIIGGLTGYFFVKSKYSNSVSAELFNRVSQEKSGLAATNESLAVENKTIKEDLISLRNSNSEFTAKLASANSNEKNLESKLSEINSKFAVLEEDIKVKQNLISELKEAKVIVEQESKSYQEKLKLSNNDLEVVKNDLSESKSSTNLINNELTDLKVKFSSLSEQYSNLKETYDTLIKEFNALTESMKSQFQNIANEILEEKSKKFTEQNKTNIDSILNPLSEKIKDFEKKVDTNYNTENAQREVLRSEILRITELNKLLSEQASNLTNALKAEVKTQGNWGESILEKILENSGLKKDIHYKKQESFTDDDNKKHIPDFIILMPQDRYMVIDSKVSLVAYEKYCSCNDEEEKKIYLKNHIESLKKHIMELSSKNYQQHLGNKSLDFVLMFVNPEPAFNLGIQEDPSLYDFAFSKKIILITPTNLFAVIKVVDEMWRRDNQSKHADEIFKSAGDLYDKFAGFLEEYEKIEGQLKTVANTYDKATNRLTRGRGNVISRIENLKGLGVRSAKQISQNIIEKTEDMDEGLLLEDNSEETPDSVNEDKN